MRYNNLRELTDYSSSARRFFDTLPERTRASLIKYSSSIHTAEDLRLMADLIESYNLQS